MTAHAEWIAPDLSLTETAVRMRDNNIGCLPVGENNRLIGMITDRDIVCRAVAQGLDPKTATARDVMTQGIPGASTTRLSLTSSSAWSRSRSTISRYSTGTNGWSGSCRYRTWR
jgi:predicted transcriptional regulator